MRTTRIFRRALLVGLLAGCGRAESAPPMLATNQNSTGQRINATPTMREVFAFQTEEAIMIATERVLLVATLPPATLPPSPTFVPEDVTTNCGPLDDFIPRNCWRSEQRGIAIQAGLRTTNPRQGAVQFFDAGMEIFDTPLQAGAVKLRTVNYPYATVFTGTVEFIFNLTTRQWEGVIATPTGR